MKTRRYREELRILVLETLRRSEGHVYGLMRELEKIMGFRPPPSIMYPLLRSLYREGLVDYTSTVRGNRVLKIYRLTERGLWFLDTHREKIDLVMRRASMYKKMEELGARRVMESLKKVFENIEGLSETQLRELRELFYRFEKEIDRILSEV